jgi:methionyl-tRNA synthetase
MSLFQADLLAHIEGNPDWILPESRRNEILGFLQNPLEDLSISRPRSRVHWGIPLPFDEDHVVYVWVDALINYLTASGAIDPSQPVGKLGFEDSSASWWPTDLHLIGKDILTTHAVYWPTLLMGAGLPLPKQILAHGWWIVGKDKMSKSLGNVVDPLELREEFGADALRWYLLREMPLGSDASYTQERFLARYDELANVLGNLASRSVSMVIRYRDGVVPQIEANPLSEKLHLAVEAFHTAMEALRPHEAFGIAMDLAREVNGFIEESAPWTLAKDPARARDLDEVLATLIHALALLSALFFPVMSTKMGTLAKMLGLPAVPNIDEARGILPENLRVEASVPLFPRPERQN